MTEVAPESELTRLLAALSADDADLSAIEDLLRRYPGDARIHFMLGSLRAERGDAIGAHEAMSEAVRLAPAFEVARYQLGFFELTSGEPDRALQTWGPLLRLGESHYLCQIVEGMINLIRDEFAAAIARLERGIELNLENEPINSDIRKLIAQCRKHIADPSRVTSREAEISATAVLLRQFHPRGGH